MQAASAQTTPNAGGTAAANNSGATSPGRPTGNPAGNPSGKPPGKPDASSPFGYTPDISQVFGLTASEFQARFDSQTVPAAVLAGSNFTATVRYTNTGNLTWSGATNFKLGSQNPQDNLTWGIGRIPVAGSVGLNGSTSFTINATAPTTPGKYAFQWRMLQEAVAWFGDYTPTVLIDVIAPSNGASFVSQVPPLTVLTSGRAFSIPITFKNTGTTTWTSAAKYRLGSQGPQDNNLWLGTSNRVLRYRKPYYRVRVLPLSSSGNAPQVTSAQTLNFQWAMVQDDVAWFGDISPAMAVRVQPVTRTDHRHRSSAPNAWPAPRKAVATSGKIDGSIAYGNNNNGYSVGSPMSLIVVHAGLLADRASGYITVTPIGNVIQFLGGSANGIVTLSDSLGGCAMKLSLGAPPPVTPTISASHSPNPLLAGQPYSANWASSNAASINYLCRNNAGLVASGSSGNASGGITGTAATGWVNDPPTCTFTATSAPNASGATATASASDRLLTNLPPPPPPPPPTISVTRNPQIMSVGENYTLSWSSSNATSVKRVCTTDNSFYGFVDNSNLPLSGSTTGQPDPRWVQSRSTCTWTATSTSGATATVSETMITQPAMASTRTVTYVHTDTLGSPVAKTNANGDVISRTRYEPYGAVNQGATPTIGFTGHVNDADTGLTYMQQRYYDPMAGRFLSVDPVLTDGKTGNGFNRYVYAENNPYKYVDPDGRFAQALLRLEYSAVVYVANRLGAATAGAYIADKIYNAIHSDTSADSQGGSNSSASASASASAGGNRFPDRELPRDQHGNPKPRP